MITIAAAVFQLAGTALLVWGLRLTSDMGAWFVRDGKKIPHAGIVREHPWAVALGPWVLLVGLALQVVDSILKARC